jgi:hypothetical protein
LKTFFSAWSIKKIIHNSFTYLFFFICHERNTVHELQNRKLVSLQGTYFAFTCFSMFQSPNSDWSFCARMLEIVRTRAKPQQKSIQDLVLAWTVLLRIYPYKSCIFMLQSTGYHKMECQTDFSSNLFVDQPSCVVVVCIMCQNLKPKKSDKKFWTILNMTHHRWQTLEKTVQFFFALYKLMERWWHRSGKSPQLPVFFFILSIFFVIKIYTLKALLLTLTHRKSWTQLEHVLTCSSLRPTLFTQKTRLIFNK